MKKKILKLFAADIEAKRKSLNSLDSDARALMEETIAELQRAYEELEAEPEERGVDTVIDKIRDLVDEKFAAAMEKVKDVAPAVPAENYLKSANAIHDYAKALRNHPQDLEGFRKEWRESLSKNGITIAVGSEEAFMPELMKSRIDDNWKSDTNWLRRLNNTGAKRFALRYTKQAQDSADVRARGHKKGGTKTEQNVELEAKTLAVQAIYKLMPIDRITEFEDDGQLLEWVADEISRQMYYEISRAIVVGDGRTSSDPDKIDSFEAIDRTTTDEFVTVGTYGSYADIVEEFMKNLIEPIYDGRDTILFVTKSDLFNLRQYMAGSGATTHYASIDEVKDMLGVSDIIVAPYLDDTTSGAPRAVAMHPDKYFTVGRMDNFEFVSWEDYLTNTKYFRSETFAGGGAGMNCAAVLQNA